MESQTDIKGISGEEPAGIKIDLKNSHQGLGKKLYSAWTVSALFLLAIAIGLPKQYWPTMVFTLDNIVNIMPFILLSALLAAYLEAAGADRLVAKAFDKRVVMAITLAAIFGAISPFCSCGVIPLVAALLVAGVPLSAVMAFWIASPIMSPSMFIVTAAGLGGEFALVKILSAVAIGLLAGGMTLMLQKAGLFQNALKAQQTSCGCSSSGKSQGVTQWKIWQEAARMTKLKEKALAMVIFLTKWLTLAFILESLMVAYLPGEILANWLGNDSPFAVILAALIGVPAYLNGFAAVPVVAGLIESGMNSGAALSFMLAGAMTSIPAAVAVFSLVRTGLFVWYIGLALAGAIAAGYLYQYLI